MVRPHVIAIVQARMSSSRLPGKVLMPLGEATVIEGLLKRLQRSQKLHKIVLATSEEDSDDLLAKIVSEAGYPVVRGSLHDVLQRFSQAASEYPAEHYVRVTGDCPFIDPELVDELVDSYISQGADYASNALEPSLPDGFDCEVFSISTLQKVNQMAVDAIDREHVTHFIYTHPNLFNIYSHTYIQNLSEYRVTLDTPEDYLLVNKICELLPCPYLKAGLADILKVLQHSPDLLSINNMHRRNEGLQNG